MLVLYNSQQQNTNILKIIYDLRMFNANFNNIMGFSLIGGGNWSTLKKDIITISQEQLDHKAQRVVSSTSCHMYRLKSNS